MPVQRIFPGQKVTREKLERARQLRSEMTGAERLLWSELHANKLGAHFRRQQIIAGFIVDFYCNTSSLVIEVDGDVHSDAAQRNADARREEQLRQMGLTVLRFHNSEVEGAMPTVLARIKALIEK